MDSLMMSGKSAGPKVSRYRLLVVIRQVLMSN
jgi:hypothetical protein